MGLAPAGVSAFFSRFRAKDRNPLRLEQFPITNPSNLVTIAILLVAVVLVAFFSSSEASLISVSKVRIRHLAESGKKTAQVVQKVTEQHSRLFATILLTENLCIIFASSLGTALAVSFLGKDGIYVATLLMTFFIVVFGEITPKTFAAQNAERVSLLVARPIQLVITALTPVVWVFTLVTNGIVRVLGGDPSHKSPFVTEEEIRMLITIGEEEGVVLQAEQEMLQNVFKFGDRLAHEIMIPRPAIAFLPSAASVRDFLELFAENGHSRFPVVGQNIDDIVGIISAKDVLKVLPSDEALIDKPIQPLVRPALLVPEMKRVGELLAEMQASRNSMAVLIDEFGGTAGLVTVEDMLEEIVGELRDELDVESEEIKRLDEKTILVEAQMRVDEANEQMDLRLPLGDYETLAGFILNELGRIPETGEEFRYNSTRVRIVEMEGTRIKRVQLTKL